MIQIKVNATSCPPEVVAGFYERASRWEGVDEVTAITVDISPDLPATGDPETWDWIGVIRSNANTTPLIIIGAHRVPGGEWGFHS
jgi:hypothetical protein